MPIQFFITPFPCSKSSECVSKAQRGLFEKRIWRRVVHTIVTKHAKYRMKQRCGIGKNSINKMAKKVYQLCVRHAETSGNLQKWVDSLYFYNKSANQIRLYGDMAYIFHNQKLITVIKVPENLVPDIVAIRRFKEEKGRRKHESDRRTQKIG